MKKNYLIPTVKCHRAILEHGLLAGTDSTKAGPSADYQNNPGMDSNADEGYFDDVESDVLPAPKKLW